MVWPEGYVNEKYPALKQNLGGYAFKNDREV
jgi:hypothetical protein